MQKTDFMCWSFFAEQVMLELLNTNAVLVQLSK